MKRTWIHTASILSVIIIMAGNVVMGAPARKIKITFNGYAGAETLTNFPVLVTFSTNINGFSYNDFASATGDDLRFTSADGTTIIEHEMDKWDTNGVSTVWVKIPSFTNNTTIYAYWAGTWSGSAPAYTTNGAVWSEGYVGVYHLSETGSVTTYTDSSSNANDLVAISAPAEATGVAGGARTFTLNNTDQPLKNSAISSSLTLDETTVSVWCKMSGINDWKNPWGIQVGSDDLRLEFNDTSPRNLRLYHTGITGSHTISAVDDAVDGDNEWKLLTFTASSGSNKGQLYVNGIPDGLPSDWSATATATGIMLGAAWASGHGGAFSGTLDEARFSNVARSYDWIKACYQYQGRNSENYTTYSSVAQTNILAPIITNSGVSKRGLSSATVKGTLTAGTWAGVKLYYGKTDGGAGSWEHTNVVSGIYSAGDVVSVQLGNLNIGTKYYYAFYASNSKGTSLAQASGSFQTRFTDEWDWKTDISFTGYTGTTPLTNFPALIKLGTHITNFDYSEFSSTNAADLRFTDADGTTVLPYEIDEWDISGTSYVWVRIPLLTSNTIITAYWGNDSFITPPYYTTDGSVWSEDYVGVYHFNETGTRATFKDSSPYGNDAWAPLSPIETSGQIGTARAFGANSFSRPVRVLNPKGDLDVSDFTMAVWANTSTNTAIDWKCWSSIKVSTNSETRLTYRADNGGNCEHWASNLTGANTVQYSTKVVGDSNWHALAFSPHTGTYTAKIYVDGVQDGDTWVNWSASGAATGFKIGAGWTGSYPGSLGATIDEARYSKSFRSADWMKAENDTQAQNATFTYYGSVSAIITGTTVIIR